MDDGGPRPDDVEFLDIGPTRGSGAAGRERRRGPRWLALLGAGVVAAVVIAVITRPSSKPSASPRTPGPTGSPASAPATPPIRDSGGSTVPPVAVTDLGHPILGVTNRWDLFGRGDGVVVRIQLDRGRITRTTIPALSSGGPVSFVVGADEAIVRPIDYVPGFVVPDGRPAHQLSVRLGPGGPMFPGPDPNHVWVASENDQPSTMSLTALDADHAGPAIPIPGGSSSLSGSPDGAGGVLFPSDHGFYDVQPTGLHRVSTGSLVATGPTGWLAVECHPAHRCATVAIDRATGTRRVVPVRLAATAPPGAISPDGRTAALFEAGPTTGSIRLYLLDVASGGKHEVKLPLDESAADETIAWSPDSRRLFALGANGKVYAADADDGKISDLGVRVPRLRQLAIRNLGPN